MLGASIDIGLAVRTKFQLASGLAAASNYALANASSANSSSGATRPSSFASLIASANAANWANATVNVNNGPTASMSTGSTTVTAGGTASGADSCYCPSGSESSITWGTAVTCGSSCSTSGPLAWKFIRLTASRAYTPMIMAAGVISSPITATSVVQVQ